MRPFEYPPDSPDALWDLGRWFGALGNGFEDLEVGASRAAKTLDAADWQGRAATAGFGALTTRVRAARVGLDKTAETRAAIETYAGAVVRARTEIDMLRVRAGQATAALPDVGALAGAFARSPSLNSLTALTDGLAAQAAGQATLSALRTDYARLTSEVSQAAWDATRQIAANLPAGTTWSPDRDSMPDGSGKINPEDGLGDPVPGSKRVMPATPPWPTPDHPNNEGYDTDHDNSAFLFYLKMNLLSTLANSIWPDAGPNLVRYLGNTGAPMKLDADKMLRDLGGFRPKVDNWRTRLANEAIRHAKAKGGSTPVTFPVSAGWEGYYAGPQESEN